MTDTLSRVGPRRWRRAAITLSVVTVSMIAAACGGGSPSGAGAGGSSATSQVDTLVMANAVKVDTLDPEQNSVNESIWIDQNLYSRLVAPDAAGTKIVPDLATGWDVSSDQLTYTFHLRDAKFSDGSPVTAQDAVWSINRAKALDGGWGFLITAVKSITAPDAKTVVVTLSKPHAPLLADLAMYAYSVLPQKQVESQGNSFFTHPIGSGPFVVTSYNPDSEIDFTTNTYWYGTKPKIKNVKLQIVTNDNTRLLDLQAGKVDVIENPPSNLVSQINANPKLRSDLFPSTRVDFIQLSGHNQYFKNQKVRQAVKAAIDLNEMNKLAYQNTAVPATSFMPYKMQYWNANLPKNTVDIAKAKNLLAQAGFPNGFTTNIITVSGDAAGQAEAVVIKSDLAKIGITVNIESYELVTAYDKEQTGNYGIGERYWTNDIIDPDEVVTFGVVESAGSNSFDTYWSDPTATNLANQARSETSSDKRAQMYGQIQQIVNDQVPYLPLQYPPFRYAQGKWVHGFQASPLGSYNNSLLTLTVDQH
ncbi:MAG TPA: ABC transporter substrate-binding protein [Pseudonocardiaceae bacterium]|nr:ABC transporter substrate-binding protein [Pseudonocardiaceae bacterium]